MSVDTQKKEDAREVYALFAIIVISSAFGTMTQTAVSSFVTDIMGEFSITVDVAQWVTTSYMLVLGIAVPVATFLSRRLSVRQHVILALCIFLTGSCVSLFAQNFQMLLVGGICQAVCTGMLMPLMQTIAMTRFPDGQRATAMGIGGIALGFAPNIGPTIGGAMSYLWGWRSFFIVLVCAAIVLALLAIWAIKPRKPQDADAKLEVVSLLLSSLGFGGLLLGFSNASTYSIASGYVVAPLVLGVVFLTLFVLRQNRISTPLISMDIMSNARYRAGFIAQNLLHASFMGVTLLIPLYVVGLCGGTTLDAASVLLPGMVIALFMNPLAGFLTDRFGIRPVSLVAASFLTVGAVAMSFLDADSPLWMAMVCQGTRAVGVSGLIGPFTAWSLSDLPRNRVSDGASWGIAVRQACASLGTAVMIFAVTTVSVSSWGVIDPSLAYQVAFGFSALMAASTLIFVVAQVR